MIVADMCGVTSTLRGAVESGARPARRSAGGIGLARPVATATPDQIEDALDFTEADQGAAEAGPGDWLPWDEADARRHDTLPHDQILTYRRLDKKLVVIPGRPQAAIRGGVTALGTESRPLPRTACGESSSHF